MRRASLMFRLACLALALKGPAAGAQSVRLSADVDSVWVGERFSLSVVVEHGLPGSATFQEVPDGDPELGPLLVFGDAEVFTATRFPPVLGATSRQDSLVYEAATFAVDQAILGPIPVDVIHGEDTLTVLSGTLSIPVRSALSAADEELRPPGPPLSFPSPLLFWVLIGATLLLLLLILGWLLRRRRNATLGGRDRPAPFPEAIQRMEALVLPTLEKDVKPFYVELSDLLRAYLSRSMGVHALELTTRELTDALIADRRTPEVALKGIRGTLRVADLVKFADARPNTEEHISAMIKTREAIESIEAVLCPPEPADGEAGAGTDPTAPAISDT